MGQPKRTKKHYKKPRKTWDKKRMDDEAILVKNYGLKNKREIRRIESILRRKRHSARMMLGLSEEERLKKQAELMQSLEKIGVLGSNATLDDVLGLEIKDFMERRLQTIVWRKGLANTIKQARQIIVHGHIAINGKKVDRPNYLVLKDEENKISYFGNRIKLEPKEKPAKAAAQEETAAAKEKRIKKVSAKEEDSTEVVEAEVEDEEAEAGQEENGEEKVEG